MGKTVFATGSRGRAGGEEQAIAFPPQLNARGIDKAFTALAPPEFAVSGLLLDLSRVNFVDPTALLYLTAAISSLIKRGREVALEMPASQKVRDLMRRYRFGAALQSLIDRPATSLLTQNSVAYLNLPQRHFQAHRQHIPGIGLVERASMGIAGLDVLDKPGIDGALVAADRWREPDVKALLARHLGGRANLIAPGIVFEALANAVFHPKASRVVTNGFLDRRATGGKKRAHGMLTVAFWDDGDSLISTLGSALEKRGNLRSENFDLYYDWYSVLETDRPGSTKKTRRRVFSGSKIGPDAKESDLLVAAAFPGVTRDPGSERPKTTISTLGPQYDRPGMGLYILTSLAIDSFGGEVLIRTGSASANFKRAPAWLHERSGCRYQVKVIQDPQLGRYFSGNQVVVRLPLVA